MKITFEIEDDKLAELLNGCKLDDEPTLTTDDIGKVEEDLSEELGETARFMVEQVLSDGNDEGATTSLVMALLGYSGEE